MTMDYSTPRKDPSGLVTPRKMAGLMAQFNELEIDMIGIQEARSPKEAFIVTEHYIAVCTQAKRGQGGCQLWLRRAPPARLHAETCAPPCC